MPVGLLLHVILNSQNTSKLVEDEHDKKIF